MISMLWSWEDKAGSREKEGGKKKEVGGKLYTCGVDHQSAHFRFIIIPMISRTFVLTIMPPKWWDFHTHYTLPSTPNIFSNYFIMIVIISNLSLI